MKRMGIAYPWLRLAVLYELPYEDFKLDYSKIDNMSSGKR